MTRSLTLAAGVLLLTASVAFAGQEPYFGSRKPAKEPKVPKPGRVVVVPPVISAGGETFATATTIPGLPYVDVDNTCGHVNDNDPVCTFSAAPDLFYKYTPAADQCINAQLCNSIYDTVIQVFDAGFNVIACNDDFCGDGLQSSVRGVALTGGQTYYISVDGFSDDCGEYMLEVAECPPPCSSACPPGSIAENEQTCEDEYVDVTNGGCNSIPPVFHELACNELGVTVCGTTGNFVAGGFDNRDTDWYSFTIDKVKNVSWCVCGPFPTRIAILNAATGCDVITLECLSDQDPGVENCCQATLAPGTYWLFVSTVDFFGVDCGTGYVGTLTGLTCPVVNVEARTWTQMKGVYR